MIAAAVYLLCAVTSAACAVFLSRGYSKSRVRLLFWSAICFAGLALSNVFLYIDLVVYREVQSTWLSLARTVPSLLGMSALVFGLIWEDL